MRGSDEIRKPFASSWGLGSGRGRQMPAQSPVWPV